MIFFANLYKMVLQNCETVLKTHVHVFDYGLVTKWIDTYDDGSFYIFLNNVLQFTCCLCHFFAGAKKLSRARNGCLFQLTFPPTNISAVWEAEATLASVDPSSFPIPVPLVACNTGHWSTDVFTHTQKKTKTALWSWVLTHCCMMEGVYLHPLPANCFTSCHDKGAYISASKPRAWASS